MAQLVSIKTRRAVRLGTQLAKGGEGAIWSVVDAPAEVAKLYLRAPKPAKVDKLRIMSGAASVELSRVAAWPSDVLADSAGQVAGFLMPKIAAHADAHELYSPKSRAVAFPEADFRFIVHVAANVARAFGAVHRARYVIGDINHGHLLVGRDGRVVLIDCDSFQTPTSTGVLTCDVGSPLFTPPELQSRSFTGLIRAPNHDLFGLAVLLFHLLCMGRHPYAGVWSGRGEMPIEKAISERRFAYGSQRRALGMERPPGTIPLDALGPDISGLFEAAFASAPNPQRPIAARWVAALDALKSNLKQCRASSAHHYFGGLNVCPWCAVEAQTGARLFGHKIVTDQGQATVDIAVLWRQIDQVVSPPPDPPLPSTQPWVPPPGIDVPSPLIKNLRIGAAVIAACGGLVACSNDPSIGPLAGFLGLGMAFAIWPRVAKDKRDAANAALGQARLAWNQIQGRWTKEATVASFDLIKVELSRARSELDGLPARRARMMAELQAQREAHQKRQYLDRFRVDRAGISGIGPGRASTLASFGIETAADVDRYRILEIHGFGPTLCKALLEWRWRHEVKFRFNPATPIDPREIARIEHEIVSRRNALTSQLQGGARELLNARANIVAARTRLGPLLATGWTNFRLAEARQKAL